MRSITAKQFVELKAFKELYPFKSGEGRLDMRFALMTAEIVRTLGGSSGGHPYTTHVFLRQLMQAEQVEEQKLEEPKREVKQQSTNQMELLLDDWILGHNEALKEKHRKRRGR